MTSLDLALSLPEIDDSEEDEPPPPEPPPTSPPNRRRTLAGYLKGFFVDFPASTPPPKDKPMRSRTHSLDGSERPKRKSLHERIDEDHPLSLSMTHRLSPGASRRSSAREAHESSPQSRCRSDGGNDAEPPSVEAAAASAILSSLNQAEEEARVMQNRGLSGVWTAEGQAGARRLSLPGEDATREALRGEALSLAAPPETAPAVIATPSDGWPMPPSGSFAAPLAAYSEMQWVQPANDGYFYSYPPLGYAEGYGGYGDAQGYAEDPASAETLAAYAEAPPPGYAWPSSPDGTMYGGPMNAMQMQATFRSTCYMQQQMPMPTVPFLSYPDAYQSPCTEGRGTSHSHPQPSFIENESNRPYKRGQRPNKPPAKARCGDKGGAQRMHDAMTIEAIERVLSTGRITPGDVLRLAKDARGSRILQEMLPQQSTADIELARDELKPHLAELATHPFANYLVSRLAAVEQFADALEAAFCNDKLATIVCNAQGSRVVQSCMRSFDGSRAHRLARALVGRVTECAIDTHGSWAVCTTFDVTRSAVILAEICTSAEVLAKAQHGCRAFQSVMQHAAESGMDIHEAVDVLRKSHEGLYKLSEHPYANYAVQVLLKHSSKSDCAAMVDKLLPRVFELASSRYGSNVSEVVISIAPVEKLHPTAGLVFNQAHRKRLSYIMAHPYGNYVLQSLLRRLEGWSEWDKALTMLREESSSSNYGMAILARLGAIDVADAAKPLLERASNAAEAA